MTTFPPFIPGTASARPGLEGLPLKASHIDMPSDKLVVFRIVQINNRQRYGSSNTPLHQGFLRGPPCSPNITAPKILRHTPLGISTFGALKGSNNQGHEATSVTDSSSSVAEDVISTIVHEGSGGDAEDGSDQDWEDCSDCSTLSALSVKQHIRVEQAPEDKKIDRLVNKILEGRRVHFRSLPDGQGYQVSDETDTTVAKTPEQHSRVTEDVKESVSGISPSNSLHSRSSSTTTNPARRRVMDFDTQIAPARLRDQLENNLGHNVDANCGHASSTSGSESSGDQAPWVIGIGHNGVEAYAISPIPFDIHQIRKSMATPSIESEGSESECSSPLVRKYCAPARGEVHLEAHSRVSAFGEASRDIKTRGLVNVWRDSSSGSDVGGSSRSVGKLGTILKDVSNTRRSLQTVHKTWGDGLTPEQKDAGNQIRDNLQHSQRLDTALATLHHHSVTQEVQASKVRIKPQKSIWIPAKDPERAAHFAAALEAIEGKVVLVGTPDPLVRCVDQVFGENVLVEYSMPALFHPKPMRIMNVKLITKRMEEKVTGPMWDYSDDGLILEDRPGNPTPYAA
ncbi:MAG: hypothetical protein M1830_004746, partial [Pleopsidium flavum]